MSLDTELFRLKRAVFRGNPLNDIAVYFYLSMYTRDLQIQAIDPSCLGLLM